MTHVTTGDGVRLHFKTRGSGPQIVIPNGIIRTRPATATSAGMSKMSNRCVDISTFGHLNLLGQSYVGPPALRDGSGQCRPHRLGLLRSAE